MEPLFSTFPYGGAIRVKENYNTPNPTRPEKSAAIEADPAGRRGWYSVLTMTGTGETIQAVSANPLRNYFEIQNLSETKTAYLSFGAGGGQIALNPLASWWSNVTPINEVFLKQEAGEQCTIILSSAQG